MTQNYTSNVNTSWLVDHSNIFEFCRSKCKSWNL